MKDVVIDPSDMFLLALVEDEVSLTQLVGMAPCKALECVRHVLHLTRLGLLDVDYESFDEQLLLVRIGETAAGEALDNAPTLRPPPRQSKPDPSSLIGAQPQPNSGTRARPTPATGTPLKRTGA